MTTLTATLALALAASYTKAQDLGAVQAPLKFTPTFQFTQGTGAGQAQILWHDTRTLAASASEDLDLAGALTDAFGATVTIDKVKALVITADPTNVNNVLVGGAASAQAAPWFGAATDKLVVRPGGLIALVAPDATGYDITATSADLLKIANSSSGSAVTYSIVILAV
jgi:hypothetical protein